MKQTSIETSLGPLLTQVSESEWEIDLTQLRIFFGLSILSKSIGEEIGNELTNSPGDLAFSFKLNPNINHELVDMHIQYVHVTARAGILKDFILFRETFEEHLRFVFGSFQQQAIAKKIHPEFYSGDTTVLEPVALLFPFSLDLIHPGGYYILLERVASVTVFGEFFLRITIDTQVGGTLALSNIPHEIVYDAHTRTYIAGSSKISESLSNSIINAAQKGETFFEEENSHFSRVFAQIEKTPLGRLTHLNFFWEDEFRRFVLSNEPSVTLKIFKKLFLLLEDEVLARKIKEGNTIQTIIGKLVVYVELSRLDRVLNFSFNKRRTLLNSDFYLKRMPKLEAIANANSHKISLSGTHIFLIHHITSEIVSLIETFRRLSVKSLNVAFVKYGGNIPPAYLDVLLDIPTDNFFMAGLEFKLTENRNPYYAVSPLYSDFGLHKPFSKKLEESKLGFFDAMRRLSVYLFLNSLLTMIEREEKLILVEDGGYVAPVLHDYSLSKKTLADICEDYWVEYPKSISGDFLLSSVLNKFLIGSVEHTRNGYDRLLQVTKQHGSLAFPSFSIAVSREKTLEESKEVARSIINAIDNTLHGLGKVFSKRTILLLGAEGNIGGFLRKYLVGGVLHELHSTIYQVDKKFSTKTETQFPNFSDVPLSLFCEIDFVLGVTGESIILEDSWEYWILNSHKDFLFLASGSTKTVEFSGFIHWVNKLNLSDKPKLNGHTLELQLERILDPQTQMELGSRVVFAIPDLKIQKTIYLIADGSPVNFLFYGVPTESMDPIISQLATVTLGMANHAKSNSLPSPGLYAVDHQIDAWGILK